MRPSRRAADVPLAALVVVGGGFLVGLAAFGAAHALSLPQRHCHGSALAWLGDPAAAGVTVPAALAAVVLVSAALALAHQLLATRRVLARVLGGRCRPTERVLAAAERAGLAGRLDLVADAAAFTFCYGFRSPRVCLSRGMAERLEDDELLAVMRHEAHHLRHRDPFKILLSRTLASGLGFLPVAGALHDGYLSGKELCADAEARALGGPAPLARALMRLLGARQPTWPAGVLAIGALSTTEARIRQLVDPGSSRATLPRRRDWIATLLLVVGIFGFSHGAAEVGRAAPLPTGCAAEHPFPTALQGHGGARLPVLVRQNAR